MAAIVTRAEAEAILGDISEQALAEIIATGATAAELAEAHAWLANDEAMLNDGRPMPSGRVAEVVSILSAEEEQEEAPGR